MAIFLFDMCPRRLPGHNVLGKREQQTTGEEKEGNGHRRVPISKLILHRESKRENTRDLSLREKGEQPSLPAGPGGPGKAGKPTRGQKKKDKNPGFFAWKKK